jgi:Ca2+-binding RTX toxin-like protein
MNTIFFTLIGIIILLSFISLQSVVESIYGDHGNDRLFAGNTFVESNSIVTADVTGKALTTGLASGFKEIFFTDITCTSAQIKCYGSKGDDSMIGDNGNNQMHGFLGNDKMFGGDGNDWMVGYEGNDEINGGSGADKIQGYPGADRIFGGEGNDVIWHDSEGMARSDGSRDIISCGGGFDTVTYSTRDGDFAGSDCEFKFKDTPSPLPNNNPPPPPASNQIPPRGNEDCDRAGMPGCP